MKKIRKNAVEKIKAILKAGKQVEYFLDSNNYNGGDFGGSLRPEEIKHTLDDLRNEFCFIYEAEGYHVVKYAGHCKWVIRAL